MNKSVVLTFSKYYLPGFKAGGPIVSISNIIAELGEEFDFRLIASDRDIDETSPFPNISVGTWTPVGKASVCYLVPQSVSMRVLVGMVRAISPEIIYLNSYLDRRFTARILLARYLGLLPETKLLLAPRGEFSKGALQQKPLRKKIHISALKALGILNNVTWHASTSFEAEDIVLALGKAFAKNIHVAPDLGTWSAENLFHSWVPRAPQQPLRICFLSRISPMKNLKGALQALTKMKNAATFTVYGPKESSQYWQECLDIISTLPPHITFVDGDTLRPDQVHETLAKHDVMFLPTLGENYGHVILEALSVGVPVIISDRTPWRGLTEKGVGYDGPLDENRFAAELDLIAGLNSSQMLDIRRACRTFASGVLKNPAAIDANRRLFGAGRG